MMSPFVAAYMLNRYHGNSREGWHERWGHLPDALVRREGGKPRVWIHAVSAGEVVAAVPILRELRTLLPHYELLLSVITPAGRRMAEQQAAPYVDGIFYSPFDLPWAVRRAVAKIAPDVFVSLESELWPNLLHDMKRIGAATVMVNGRISDKNFRRVQRVGGWLFRWMLSNMDRLLMQSALDAQRIREIGKITEPGRVAVVGNSKFDQEIPRLSHLAVQTLRHALHLPPDAPVFVAGSTRSPEEEAIVIESYLTMRQQIPELCLLIAPRQIDRGEELAAAMRTVGLEPVRKTEIDAAANSTDASVTGEVRHLILDTMGELVSVYAVATVVFVGNSFAPVNSGGGQNLLQPLAHGKPVLFGPLTATTRAEAALTIEAGVGFRVENGSELAREGLRLLHDPALCDEIASHALDLIAANQGVSVRYAEAIRDLANRQLRPVDRLTEAIPAPVSR